MILDMSAVFIDFDGQKYRLWQIYKIYMKNKIFLSLAIFVVISSFIIAVPFRVKGEKQFERKIVVFKEGVNLNTDEEDGIVLKHGGIKIKELKLIRGKAVLLSKEDEDNLKKENSVLRIDSDIIVRTLGKDNENDKDDKNENVRSLDRRAENNASVQPMQVLPWGVNRIDAEKVWNSTSADLIKVAVIDTGIELSHPDLSANIKGGINTIDITISPNDDNGHGTHVAGIIGALNNTIGVVGVGPKIDLYAVKVLNRNGSGFLSDVIEGIDWAVTNKIQVINMSLGTPSNIQSFHDAVIRAYNAGVVVVAAAGNDNGRPVNFPAAYPETIAVSATDSLDNVASFSSAGPEVDLAAPGVSIFSTYRGKTYRTLSGTSMASPHAAGAAALLMSVSSKCDTDLNGVCSPLEVKNRLELTAEDFGAVGHDNFYGAGIVNINRALTL